MNKNIDISTLELAIRQDDLFGLQEIAAKGDYFTLGTALFVALYQGKPEICKFLINLGANCNIRYIESSYFDCSTSLIDALRRKYFDVAEIIYDRGFKINYSCDAGPIVIYEMLRACNQQWRDKLTIDNAAFKVMPLSVKTALIFFASRDNEADILNRLLDKNIDANQRMEHNNTALHIACQYRSFDAINMLLMHNYDVNAVNDSLRTPLHLLYDHVALMDKTTTKLAEIIQSEENERFLEKLFEDLDDSPPIIDTTQTIADNSFEQTIKIPDLNSEVANTILLLIHLSKDINQQDKRGDSALHLGVEAHEEIEKLELLLRNGADVNLKNIVEDTPIYRTHRKEYVEYLLKQGARLDVFNCIKETPFEHIVHCGFADIIEMIFKYWDMPPIHPSRIQGTLDTIISNKYPMNRAIEYLVELGGKIDNSYKT